VLLGLFILCLLASPRALRADDGVPLEVAAAAQQGLPEYLRAVPQHALSDYGFSSTEELVRARLGQPHRVHYLTLAGLQQATTQQLLQPILTSTDLWIFPVLVDERPATLLWVDRMPDGYRAVQLGDSALAQVLSQWETRLPALLRQQGIAAFELRLVQIPQLSTDLLLLSSPQGEHLALLHAPLELSDALAQDRLLGTDDMLPLLLDHFSRLRSDSSSDLATAGGSPATEPPTRPQRLVPTIFALALMLTTCACLWRWRYGRHGGGL
jgi:hypothetical protein